MNNISSGSPVNAAAPIASAPGKSPQGFGERLKNVIGEVNSLQHAADQASQAVVKGELGIHEGMLSLTQADMALRLLIQVRNKALEAYREIMRMQF